jgi:hypothetical protein
MFPYTTKLNLCLFYFFNLCGWDFGKEFRWIGPLLLGDTGCDSF